MKIWNSVSLEWINSGRVSWQRQKSVHQNKRSEYNSEMRRKTVCIWSSTENIHSDKEKLFRRETFSLRYQTYCRHFFPYTSLLFEHQNQDGCLVHFPSLTFIFLQPAPVSVSVSSCSSRKFLKFLQLRFSHDFSCVTTSLSLGVFHHRIIMMSTWLLIQQFNEIRPIPTECSARLLGMPANDETK